MKTEVISFRESVMSGQNGSIKERLKSMGRVTEVRIRFYAGQEGTLRISPYILHKNSRREDIVTYANNNTGAYLNGDDDYFIFPVSIDFDNDDEFVVEYINYGGYTYTLKVDVIVNYLEHEGDY